MKPKEFRYEIGDKSYIQRKLVIGQMKLLSDLLPEISLPSTFTIRDVINKIGQEKLPEALAVVLTPISSLPPLQGEGRSGDGVPYWQRLRDKDIPGLAEELINSIEPETVLEVARDFFDCNPIASFYQVLSGMLESLVKRSNAMSPGKINSKSSSSPSPEETSSGETKSSGDTPPKSAGPSLSTA